MIPIPTAHIERRPSQDSVAQKIHLQSPASSEFFSMCSPTYVEETHGSTRTEQPCGLSEPPGSSLTQLRA